MTDHRVTQVGVEQWVQGPSPSGRVTQVSAEHWATVIFYQPGALHADGQAQVAFTGRLLRPGAARMDGQAQASFTSVRVFTGAARMDGQAQASFSRIAVTSSAAVMNGHAQVGFTGAARTAIAARMDGHASMVVISKAGAGVAHMDGVASMVVVATRLPITYVVSITDSITSYLATKVSYSLKMTEKITSHLATNVRHHMWVNLQHNINLRQPTTFASVRSRAAWQDTVRLADSRVLKLVQKLQDNINIVTLRGMRTQYHYEFIDPVSVLPVSAPSWSAVLNLAQGVGISQATSQKFIWGRALTQALKIFSSLSAGGTYKISLAQLLKIIELEGLKLRHPVALSQGIDLSSLLVGGISLKLLQKLLVTSASSPTLNYHLALLGQLLLADIPGHYHFAAMVLEELLTVQPVLDRQFVASNSLAELLTISPVFTSKLILKITGSIQLSPEQLVSMIYAGDPLLDEVTITALYISPSGTTTTWAVNTRTNAVTEYLNYDFRSFAQMGDRYIAAGADGLYELDGDTDDGDLIISRMMSGYLQLNEKKLFGIKGAYVAIRGGGRFYLKLISGDGREYVYELKAQPNLMTTKVRVGKGIKTTYMAFELMTEGQDWDLDSIEFIPMTSGRRV